VPKRRAGGLAQVLGRGAGSDPLRGILKPAGVRVIVCPPRAPSGNAFAERFVRSIKSEFRDRLIFVEAGSLRHALAEYAEHYNRERPHQGIGNRIIDPEPVLSSREGAVDRHARLIENLRHRKLL
jgi:transposase InsO family protein